MKYIIPYKPIPMSRPRFGNNKVFYSQKKEKFFYGIIIKKQHGTIPHEGPIVLDLLFFMPIPKSYSKKNRALIINQGLYHAKKPDIDNLIAFILNCMIGIVYKDDAQVCSIKSEKKYSDNPRVEIVVQCKE